MKIINYILILAVSLFAFSCGDDEADSINQDFKLKTNLEYGNTVKIGEELKIGIVVDSIDSNFKGSWTTTISTNIPTNCSILYNNENVISSDKLNHDFKAEKTLWLNFKANKTGEFRITANVSNGSVDTKTINIDISVSEYTYKITLSCDANEGEVFGAGVYKKGAKVTIDAKPKNGYTFVAWYKDGVKAILECPHTLEVKEDITYEARFEKSIFKVEAEIEGEGTIVGLNDYPKGSNVTLTATANKYWKFEGWYNQNGSLLSRETTYNINNIEENIKLKAKFIQNVYIYISMDTGGTITNTTCSLEYKKVASKTAQMRVNLFAYKNNTPINVNMVSESLTLSFDYTYNIAIWAYQNGNPHYYCEGYDDTVSFSENFTIYNTNQWKGDVRTNPRGDYGGWCNLKSVHNVKFSPKEIKQTGNPVILNPVVTATIGTKVIYFTILTTKSAGIDVQEMEPIPFDNSYPVMNI